MAESISQVVIELDKIKDDLKNYQYNNDQNLKEFKKETRGKFEKVDETVEKVDARVDLIERQNISLEMRITGMETSLKEIKDNTQFTKRTLLTALIGGGVTLLVTAIIFFATK